MAITHAFVATLPDGTDPLQVQALRDWNDGHVVDAGTITGAMLDSAAQELFKGITLDSPTASDDVSIGFTILPITISQLTAVVRGSTPSLTWTLRHDPDRSAVGNEVVTGGTVTTSESTGSVVTVFDDATIPANSYYWLETTAKSGTVSELHLSIFLRKD
jgi:hypothetical protein